MLLTLYAIGQGKLPYSISLNGGVSVFYGDVKEYRFAPTTLNNSEIRPAGELQVRYSLNESVFLNGMFAFSSVSGTDKEKDRYFVSEIKEYTIGFNISLNNSVGSLMSKRVRDRFNFLIGAQVGSINTTGKLKRLSDDGLIQTVADIEEEGGMNLVFPVEFAVQYKLNKLSPLYWRNFRSRLYLEMKAKIHFTNIDTIDLSIEDGFSNDIFGVYTIGFAYFFGR